MACVAPRGIHKAAFGAKLILTADLASPVSCVRLGRLLMAQHCHLCLSSCFTLPTAPHSLPPSTPPPIDSISDITAVGKATSKTRGIQIACRISYEILAT